MKKYILLLLISTFAIGQTNPTKNPYGFYAGSGTISSTAIGQFDSTSKGILFPRMTTAQRDAISSPATGLVIYDADTNTLNYFNGTSWVDSSGSSTPGIDDVLAVGNTAIDKYINLTSSSLPDNGILINSDTVGISNSTNELSLAATGFNYSAATGHSTIIKFQDITTPCVWRFRNLTTTIGGYHDVASVDDIPSIGSWGALNYPTWSSGIPFVKMNAAGSFILDTNTYLTSITSSNVTTALGFTPYNSSNPAGYISSVPAQSFTSLTGKPTTLSGYGITDAYPLTGNPSGFLTTISSTQISSALGYTPLNPIRSINGQPLTSDLFFTQDTFGDGSYAKQYSSADKAKVATIDQSVSSAEKATWNGKQNALGFTPVNQTTTVNGHALSSNVTITNSDLGLNFTPYKFIATTQTAVTGSVSETIVATATINGNTFNSNDVMKILFRLTKGITTSNVSLRLRVNTINSLSGATQVGVYNFLSSNTQSLFLRTFDLNGGNLYGFNFNSSAQNDFTSGATSPNSIAYNTANTLYFFFTVQLGTSSDSITPNLANITN